VLLGFFALVFAYPQPAHAGFFSFFENLFSSFKGEVVGADAASASVVPSPSNEMPVLDAPTNSNPAAGKKDSSISIVENTALMPSVGPMGSLADIDEIKAEKISLYTVREGDSLTAIAKTFGVTVNTILWANDIKSANLVKPGDVLVILPVSGLKYTVKKGDTLQGIAKKYKGAEEDILAFNGLAGGGDLVAGLEIIIPDGEAPSVIAPLPPKGSTGGSKRPDLKGYFARPANGPRTQGIHGYNGVDIGASCGSSIFASAAGTVILARGAGYNGGYGEYVVIGHPNGTQTLYAHASHVLVNQGQYVGQGQIIGAVGSTGRSTGCHLHFEVRGARNPF